MSNHRFLPFITGLFTASLVISNTTGVKIVAIGPVTLPAGIFLFPVTYVFGDILTEVYGYGAARRVIWAGAVALTLMALFYILATGLPAAPFWPYQREFQTTLKIVPRIALASVISFFLGEFCNSYVLAKLKLVFEGNRLSFRYVFSTLIGQTMDTTAFCTIAFGGMFRWNDLLTMGLWCLLLKVAWEIVALPITLPLTGWLKKVEKSDVFDRETDFNPFKFSG